MAVDIHRLTSPAAAILLALAAVSPAAAHEAPGATRSGGPEPPALAETRSVTHHSLDVAGLIRRATADLAPSIP